MRNSTRQTVPAKIEPQGNSDVPQRPTPQSQQAVEHYIVPIGMVSSPVHQKVWREERRPERPSDSATRALTGRHGLDTLAAITPARAASQ